jgi:hypothetical protein
MALSFSMASPSRSVQLLQQFAQHGRSDVVMELAADLQIGALLALVLAETAREANRSLAPLALLILLQDGEDIGVPPSKTGTP